MEPTTKKRKLNNTLTNLDLQKLSTDPLRGLGAPDIIKSICKTPFTRQNGMDIHSNPLNQRKFMPDNDACEVNHVGVHDVEDEVVWASEYKHRRQRMSYSCCDKDIREEYGDEDAICYADRHTTNVDHVAYTNARDYIGEHFDDSHVKTCHEMSCEDYNDEVEETEDKEVIEISD